MVSRKYVGDYRLENVPDRHGKLKTVPVYRGPLFRFKAEEKMLRRAKKRNLLLLCISTASLLATMLIRSDILQRITVVMPLVLSILPTVLLWMSIYSFLTAGETLTRDRADRIHGRFSGWSIVQLALSTLSLIGQILAYAGGAPAEGLPVTLCTAVIITAAILMFRGRDNLLTEEIIPADTISQS